MKCPRCQQENPPQAKFCLECGAPINLESNAAAAPYTELQRTLTEALEQQKAAAEILRVISLSPTDLPRVFAAVLASAARLCDAIDATLFRVEGEALLLVAHEGSIPAHAPGQFPLVRGTPPGRVVLERRTVHVADLQAEVDEFPEGSAFARLLGFRTILGVPLLRGDEAIGVITLRRADIRPFTERQAGLLKTFADQALIAIENARLFTELQEKNRALTQAHAHVTESLEQQTATSEILRVIASSRANLEPVLGTVVQSAARLCEAYSATLILVDGDVLHIAANYGPLETSRPEDRVPLTRGSVAGRSIIDRQPTHVLDLANADEAEFPLGRALAARFGHRTTLAAPLLREGTSLGTIVIRRREVRSFSDRQITLLQTFADQAVIAIENVRLFKELEARNRDLTEALEQQTATGEILRLISQSPTDVQPVFEAIVASAARLCDAAFSAVTRFEGGLLHLVAVNHVTPEETEAYRSLFPRMPGRHFIMGRAFVDGRPVHVEDVLTDPDYDPRRLEVLQRAGGFRTYLGVPIIRDGVPIGAIGCGQREVRPFTATQIELVKTFADQAVIAIENVRLFTELQEKNQALTQAHEHMTEALDRQTATSDILRVISSSPTDVQPIFDAIVRSASRLCGGEWAIVTRYDGELLHLVAQHNPRPGSADAASRLFPHVPQYETSITARALVDSAVVHVSDVETEDLKPSTREQYRRIRLRAVVAVPMVHEGRPIGVVSVSRGTPGPFSDRQIDLLRTFADQAVIAIENTRLFTELQEKNRQITAALEQQTATSEILRVIASSPTDLQPVLDAVAQSAARLCNANDSLIYRLEGDRLELVAKFGPIPSATGSLPLTRALVTGRAVIDRQTLHIEDLATQLDEFPDAEIYVRRFSHRTILITPLLREGVALGAIAIRRTEVHPFSDTQIALLKTFADQAVIAIENVRLFTELQTRNRELTEALEQQTATSEILRVISSSPTDVQPVFDTIVRSATRLCRAVAAAVFVTDGHMLDEPANYGGSPEVLAATRARYPRPLDRETAAGTAILTQSVVQVPDVEEPSAAEFAEFARRVGRAVGFRSLLSVPMLREGEAVGAINVTRPDPGRFSDTEVALLKTFADQAVIAIENVRLFKELQARNRDLSEALERQTATGEILDVISRSQTDVQAVFDTIVRSARALTSADIVALLRTDGAQIFVAASDGVDSELIREATLKLYPMPLDRESLSGRAILSRTIQKTADIETLPSPPKRSLDVAHTAGFRSQLTVPLLRAGEAIGAIAVSRREPGAFPDAQAELLKTFADQAVIAIENARLFNELQARTAELTRSVEQLTALGEVGRAVSSTLDLETVLTTIVSRAVQLSGLDGGVVFEYDAAAEEFVQRAQTETGGVLSEARRTNRIRRGEGVLGQTAITLESVQVSDITLPGAYAGRLRETLIESGIRAILAVPMVYEGHHLIGCLGVTRNSPGEFPAETIELMRTFATQSALAIQNARLFREIEDKSRQLEAASQHKSEFLANMSHELRTPLNAIIGFSEVLGERMFGDLNEKQDEYLKDIHASGQHLLSLINDILDLSKIEAGRMELELTDFHLPAALDNALTLVRERAGRRGIALHMTTDERLDYVRADERKVRQVVLNLLSNAIKFTPEGGRIDVRARPVDGSVEVSVTDTGVGIAPEDQEAIFEEFRQVGTADKKVEGTGLGLALSRKFIELHGGRIWVESQVGVGSTFTFTIPIRIGT